jgi:hypothetical protein
MSPKLRAELMSGAGSIASHDSQLLDTTPKNKPSLITLQERLEHGNLTIDEVCALASRSKTAFYADAKAGLVKIHKMGRRSVIPGPVAVAYLAAVTVAS